MMKYDQRYTNLSEKVIIGGARHCPQDTKQYNVIIEQANLFHALFGNPIADAVENTLSDDVVREEATSFMSQIMRDSIRETARDENVIEAMGSFINGAAVSAASQAGARVQESVTPVLERLEKMVSRVQGYCMHAGEGLNSAIDLSSKVGSLFGYISKLWSIIRNLIGSLGEGIFNSLLSVYEMLTDSDTLEYMKEYMSDTTKKLFSILFNPVILFFFILHIGVKFFVYSSDNVSASTKSLFAAAMHALNLGTIFYLSYWVAVGIAAEGAEHLQDTYLRHYPIQENVSPTWYVQVDNQAGGDVPGEEKNDGLGAIVKLFLTIFSTTDFTRLVGESLSKNFKKILENFSKWTSKDLGSVLGTLVDVFGDVYMKILGISNPDQSTSAWSILGKMSSDVEEIRVLAKEEKWVELVNSDAISRIDNFIGAIEDMLSKMKVHSKGSFVYTTLNKLLQRCSETKLLLDGAIGVSAGERVQPVSIMLRGEPGRGKTKTLDALKDELTMSYLDETSQRLYAKAPGLFVFSRNIEVEFWDGYHPSVVTTIVDDFAQERESNARTNPFMEFIRLANTHACPLRMAELTRKANSYFNSKYILMSTNRKTDSEYQSIISKEAVDRRIDFDVQCDFDPIFVNPDGTLKYEMLECVELVDEKGEKRLMPVFSPAAMVYTVSGVEIKKQQLVRFSNRKCTYEELRALAIKLHSHRMRIYRAEAVRRQLHLKEHSFKEPILMNEVEEQALKKSEAFLKLEALYDESLDLSISVPDGPESSMYRFILVLMKFANPNTTFAKLDNILFEFVKDGVLEGDILSRRLVSSEWRSIMTFVRGELTRVKLLYLCLSTEVDSNTINSASINTVLRNFPSLVRSMVSNRIIEPDENQLKIMDKRIQGLLTMNIMIDLSFKKERTWFYRMNMLANRFKNFVLCFGRVVAQIAVMQMKLGIIVYGAATLTTMVHNYLVNSSTDRTTGFFTNVSETIEEVKRMVLTNPANKQGIYDFVSAWYEGRKTQWLSDVTSGKLDKTVYADNVGKMESYLKELKESLVENQSNFKLPAKDKAFKAHPASYAGLYSSTNVTGVTEQSPTPADKAHRRFKTHNLFEFMIILSDKDGPNETVLPMGTMLFIRGALGVIPKHFVAILKGYKEQDPDSVVTVCIRTLKVDSRVTKEYKISAEDFLKRCCIVESKAKTIRDVAFVDCSGIVPPCRDIYRYFYSRSEFQSVPGRIRLYVVSHGESETTIHDCPVPYENALQGAMKIGEELVPIVDTVPYVCHTDSGDCGSLVLMPMDAKLECRIIGFHTSLSQRRDCAYGSVVFTEDIDVAIIHFEKESVRKNIGCAFMSVLEEETMVEVQQQGFGHFTKLGPVEHERSDFSATKLAKSPIGALLPWPTAKIPAKLRPFKDRKGAIVDPYKLALANYAPPHPPLPEITLVRAKELYATQLERIEAKDKDCFCRILSFEEAVAGIDGCEEVGSISRSTSAGYPYNTKTGRFPGDSKGKFNIFGKENEYDFDTPGARAVRKVTEEVISRAEMNVRSEHIFCDTLKDELRDAEKALEGKTRMFSGGPLVFLIAQRQYFGAFDAFYKRSRISNGSAIGVNPYSVEWADIVRHLCEVGSQPHQRNFGAIDHSKFDARECGFIHLLILDIIEEWYRRHQPFEDDEELMRQALVRKVLWTEIINSKHLWKNEVYVWDSSLPSGCPLTATINTMYNNIAFYYCLLRACGEEASDPQNLRLIALGDDCVFAVNDSIVHKLNEFTVPIYMAEIGLHSTREDKTDLREHDALLRPLTECTFLKREFRVEEAVPHKWVGPLALSTVLEMPMWWRENVTRESDLQASCQLALDELSLHGAEVHRKFGVPILKAYQQYFRSCPLRYTWPDCLRFVTGDSRYAL